MAILPTQTGNRDEVIARLRQNIAINAGIGPTANIALVRECQAGIFRREKRYREEEPLLLDAIADLAKQKGTDPTLMATALNNLAVLRFDHERYQESLDLQLESIRVWETALGKEHPSLVTPLNNLATSYVKIGRFEDAEHALQPAIYTCGKTLGENHPDYAVILKNYAFVLQKLDRKREAKKFKEQGLRIEQASNRRNGVGSTITLTILHYKGN